MALNELLLRNQDRIAEICTQSGIARLDAFGSIVRSDFLDASSDADFVVEFDDRIDGSALRRYFGFKSQLETLLGRPVDGLGGMEWNWRRCPIRGSSDSSAAKRYRSMQRRPDVYLELALPALRKLTPGFCSDPALSRPACDSPHTPIA